MKAIRLAIAACVTAIACISCSHVFAHDKLAMTYKCWTRASSVLDCYRAKNFDFTVDLFGIRYEGNTVNYIDANVILYGAYEKPNLFFLRDVMKSVDPNERVFVDIGANVGQHSLVMSRYSRQVHAFEPYEPVLKRFRRMIEINHINNIVIHPVGLGNANSKKPFYKPADKNLGTGSFVEGFTPANTYFGELEIQIGDEALDNAGVTSVALIKIYIEGYEKPALEGLRRTLQRNRPIVVFELSTDPQGQVSIKSKEELTSLFPDEYGFLLFDERSNRETGSYVLDSIDQLRFDKRSYHDLIAFPEEKRPSISHRGPQP